MKSNLSLFIFLILLLSITYFFQEKRTHELHQEAEQRDLLINFEINQLKLPHVNAVKVGDQWWEDKQLLSVNVFKQIEKKLQEIKKIKSIKGEWKNYFQNSVSIEINKIPWTIGELTLDKQAFYIAKDKEIFLAVIEGESTHLTQDENEIPSIKLNELLSALSKKKEELKETQLFRYYPDLPASTVVINADKRLEYELDLTANKTIPPPIHGIKVHKDIRQKFYSLLTQMTLKEEVPYSESLKFKKLGSIIFSNKLKSQTWELWLRNKTSADAFILDPLNKRAFHMVGGTLKMFFINLQDYWDKKVIPQEKFAAFTKLDAHFVQGTKQAKVVIFNKEPLAFEAKGYRVDTTKLDQLMQLIFNLGGRDQGDRVSLLSESEKKQLLSGNHLRIEIMDQEIILWRKQEEVILANLTQGYKVHFTFLDENFHGTFEDMLK